MLTALLSSALLFVFYCIVKTFSFRVTAWLEDPKPVTSQHPCCLFEYFTWCVLMIIDVSNKNKINRWFVQNFFSGVFQLKTSSKIFFQAIYKISTIQKKCCPRAEDRAIFEDLRPRGQGLDLRGQGQGLQNVSSRPRTSSRTPHLCLHAWRIRPCYRP